MRYRHCFLYLIPLMICSTLVGSQPPYQFENISIEQGLSQTSVNCIFQDHRGFLWFGTQDGLNRFDGYNLKIYKHRPFDETTLPHNWINTIAEDASGNLWIGMAGGLSIYHRQSDTFNKYTNAESLRQIFTNITVTRIYIDSTGLVWIGTRFHGLYQYNPQLKTLRRYMHHTEDALSLSSNSIIFIFEDSKHRLWIGTYKGLNLFNRNDSSFTRYLHSDGDPFSIADDQVQAMIEGPANHLWVGTYSGLSRFDPPTGRFENNLLPFSKKYYLSALIQCFLFSREGSLWIGSAQGLHLFDPSNRKFYTYLHKPDTPTSLSDNNIQSLYQDRSGLIWIGTLRRGVNKLNLLKNRFENIYKIPYSKPGLNNDFVYAFQQDSDGTLWIGTDGGLNRYNPASGMFTYYEGLPDHPNTIFVRSILRDRHGNLWVGTRGGGLICWYSGYPGSSRYRHFVFSADNPHGIPSSHIFRILEDQDGILWIATSNGLCALEPQNRLQGWFTIYKNIPGDSSSLPVNHVRALYEGGDGTLWVGTYGGGLCSYDKETQKFKIFRHNHHDFRSLSNDYVYSIFEDSRGSLWVGTYGGGLNVLSLADRPAGIFRHYYTEHGLPSNLIYGILEDNKQNIWISTTRGLASCNINIVDENIQNDERIFRHYDISDGVQSTEFNFGAYYRNTQGILFFGGINGFTFFNPQDLIQNTYIPPLSITDFKIFNRSISITTDDHLPRNITEISEINLDYSQNVVSIEFAALDFNAPYKNSYIYIMEGFDRDWMHLPPGQHGVTYTNLDPGTYRFLVKGSNRDGNWNDQPAVLKLVITPPFWMNWWFRSIIIFILAAFLFALYRTRIEHMKKQKVELEKEVAQRTAELVQKTKQLEATNYELESFSYSISHDLRNPLRSLSGYSHLVMEEIADDSKPLVKDYLQRIQNAAHQMSHLIDSLLTLSRVARGEINHSKINISVLVEWILNEFQRGSPRRKVEFKIEPDIYVQGDEILIKALFENLLANAWKFSNNQKISRIAFGRSKTGQSPKGKAAVLYLQDNGAGFDMQYYDKLFKPFQRLHNQDEFPGTGVGLAIAKRIVERHGGQIWAESKPGAGTIFYFTLSGE